MAKTVRENDFLRSLNGLAYGVFLSVVIGVLFQRLGDAMHLQEVSQWSHLLQTMMGAMIGICVAYAMNARGLHLICAMIAGTIGTVSGGQGAPLMAYLTTFVSVELLKFIEGKTSFDLFLMPLGMIFISGLLVHFLNPYVHLLMVNIASVVNQSAHLHPVLVGLLVPFLMGLITSSPILSTSIAMMVNWSGLAAGAALAGCCAHMVGFAMMSMDDNSITHVIATALGTSQFQFKNILKRPVICIPPIIASLVSGLLSTMVFKIQCSGYGAGMGMTGCVGLFEAIAKMGSRYWLPLICVDIIVPMAICWSMYRAFKKLNYIKSGDLKIQNL